MANTDTVVRPKDAAVPNFNQVEEIIPRATADVRADLRGNAEGACKSVVSIARTTVQDVDKKLRDFAYRPDAAQLLKHGSITDAEGVIAITIDTATKPLREHMAQLEAELAQVPEINEFRASEIRALLRAMPKGDRDHFISRSDDPEVLASIVHGPAAFPIASEEAIQRSRDLFNRRHRPQQAALLADARAFVEAVEGYADTVKRELRRALR